MGCCYILYSARIDSYYVGFTSESIDLRLSRHNLGFYDKAWSSRGIPWEIYLTIDCEELGLARKIESHIKRMKSKKYIQDLKRYPEIVERLKKRFN